VARPIPVHDWAIDGRSVAWACTVGSRDGGTAVARLWVCRRVR
jgi:hypothetical protein